MPELKLNLFPLTPVPNRELKLYHYYLPDNKLVNVLRTLGVMSAALDNDFGGLARGTYLLSDEETSINNLLERLSVEIDKITEENEREKCLNKLKLLKEDGLKPVSISPTSYIVKYFLTYLLKQKIDRADADNEAVLGKKSGYGTLEICKPEIKLYSEPYNFLSLRECYRLRIQHVDEKLYLQVLKTHREDNNTRLSTIIKILLENKNMDKNEINKVLFGLPVQAKNIDRKIIGFIQKIEPGDNSDYSNWRVSILFSDGIETVSPDKVKLNLSYPRTKQFLAVVLNENISEFIKKERSYAVKTPHEKIKEIINDLSWIKDLLFPLNLQGIDYFLEDTIMTLNS